jgi:uncharacterized Zn-finger protein
MTQDLTTAPSVASPAVAVQASDLQGPGAVFCPNPKMPLWSNHPRVFIDVGTTGEGKCPYCGTLYRLVGGAKRGGH